MVFFSGTRLFTLLLACVIFQSNAQEKNYTIREELPENVLIGDLVKDLGLTFSPEKKLSTPLQFKLVYKSRDLPLVRVEETTGEIYTTGVRIDREKLCSGVFGETHCFYEVEVAILPDEIFKLVKVRFLIEDVNDNAPLFPATVINISIPENTAINSRFPIPSAFDPDVGINGIQQYHLIKVPYGASGPVGVPAHELKEIKLGDGEFWKECIDDDQNCTAIKAIGFPEDYIEDLKYHEEDYDQSSVAHDLKLLKLPRDEWLFFDED